MATTVTNPQVGAQISATLVGGASPAPTRGDVNHPFTNQPTVGTAPGNVNKCYSNALAIDTASATTFDLTAAVDPLAGTLNFGTVTQIMITNGSLVAGEIITPFGGTNGVMSTGTQPINPGGCLMWDGGAAGVTVDGTHKIMRLAAAAGAAVPVKITIMGK